MKYRIVTVAALLMFLLSQCKTAHKASKVSFEFPDAMAPDIQASFAKECEKGKILYEINCASCHNKTVKHKSVIPDFTTEQIKGYEIRVSNPQHESAMPETNVTAEELALIGTFLTYKKKTGIPVR